MKIEDKPKYCHAWTSNISDEVMCNTIPCCGFHISAKAEKAIKEEGSFKDYDKIGNNQAPYYNDMRKEKALKNKLCKHK